MIEITDELRNLLNPDSAVAVLTGAGISAESGVPTFRGEEGLWSKFRPEELANVDAFMSNPDMVWAWYQHRREIINEVGPNPGHHALARMEEKIHDFSLITQNVDGLHRRAGNKNVYELHGNIQRNKCIDCGKFFDKLPDEASDKVPECDECGGKIRPDVVWFGEMLPQDIIHRAFEVAEKSALFFSIGTSAVVQPAASIPVMAKQAGAYLVEINVEPTVITSYVDLFLQGKSGEILPVILEECGLA